MIPSSKLLIALVTLRLLHLSHDGYEEYFSTLTPEPTAQELELICELHPDECPPPPWAVTPTYMGAQPPTPPKTPESKPKIQPPTDLTRSGQTLIPSIYYIPTFEISDQQCGPELLRDLIASNTHLHLRVCRKIYWSCVMEGTCLLEILGNFYLINYSGQIEERPNFIEISETGCRYGLGIAGACLDPFHTVAADPKYHRPGEVIYVEKIRGTKLPNGEIHDGYFIVRDEGKRILGEHRFDFFTGTIAYLDKSNPFSKLGLGSEKSNMTYQRVSSEVADRVRRLRGYPAAFYDDKAASSSLNTR
jgi:3D (Asp-Asp-Asp) domain-containing protein